MASTRHDRKLQGVLFDKDGTLIDFAATWVPAFETVALALAGGDEGAAARMMEASGYHRASGRLDPHSALVAGTNEEIARIWAPFAGVEDVAGLARRLNGAFREHAETTLVPVADLVGLFARLRARGLTLGVATNDSAAGAEAQLAKLEVADLIDFVAGYDSGHGGKPGPGMVHAFCRAIGQDPGTVAVVGDSPHDLEMGRAAGAGALIGVLTGASPRDLLAPLADRVIDSVSDLEDALAPWFH